MKKKTGWALSAGLGIGVLSLTVAGTVYVGPAGNDVPGCGGTSGSACQTIGFGVSVAASGDTVRVLPGTYSECVSTLGKPLALVANAFDVSGNRNVTILDGTDVCSPSLEPTVKLGSGSELRGFTVTGGGDSGVRALGGVVITRNVITGNTALQQGGGIQAATSLGYPPTDTAPLRIEYNDITSNGAFLLGGGIFLQADADATHGRVATVRGNAIRNNFTTGVSAYYIGGGGGMLVLAGSQDGGQARVVVTQNTIEGNSCAFSAAGGYTNDGGGLWAGSYNAPGGNDTIEITSNIIRNNVASGRGGGVALYAYTDATVTNPGRATITFSGNTVDFNTANDADPDSVNSGGGIWAESNGYGNETIEISSNQVRSNVSKSFGGGISAWNLPTQSFTQTVVVEGNVVSLNESNQGGGLDLLLQPVSGDIASGSWELRADDNDLTDNRASGSVGSGGGIIASLRIERSDLPSNLIQIQGNRITGNTADVAGGGAFLDLLTDGTPPPAAPAAGSVAFRNNLVSGNSAIATTQDAVGGGVFLYLDSVGDALGVADLSFNTFMGNVADFGSGGIEIESYTDFEDPADPSTPEGQARVNVSDSIVFDNDGFGVGGPFPGDPGTFTAGGTGNLLVTLRYNDAFSNQGGNYESWLSAGAGSIVTDPRLDFQGIPDTCSPTIDAADPAADYSQEPELHGGRANMGHLGGTSAAVQSRADVNRDRIVDGVDILRIAVSFGAYRGASRYVEAADLNRDDVVSGTDLAFVASQFGSRCP